MTRAAFKMKLKPGFEKEYKSVTTKSGPSLRESWPKRA